MRISRRVRFALRITFFVSGLYMALLLLLPGCGTPATRLNPYSGTNEIGRGHLGYTNTLQVQYLGVGGFLFRRGDDCVLTPPFYSNPHPIRFLPFVKARADTNRIDRSLPPIGDAAVILVGHAHYDHLMDLPHIANHRATNATIIGSTTTMNVLSAAVATTRFRAITNDCGVFKSGGMIGQWHSFRDNAIRVMALESGHAPQVFNLPLFEGEVTEPLTELPDKLRDWKGGKAFAYIIDFLTKTGDVEYRMIPRSIPHRLGVCHWVWKKTGRLT